LPKDLARLAGFRSRFRPSIVAHSVTAIKTFSIQSSTGRLATDPTSELTGDRKWEGEMTIRATTGIRQMDDAVSWSALPMMLRSNCATL